MATLPAFRPPADLSDLSDAGRSAWSAAVGTIFDRFLADHPQFYDPTRRDVPSGTFAASVPWPAFPARVARESTSEEGRWRQADEDRGEQDEYCEWSTEKRNDGKIVRVTFTTEVPEYWEHVAAQDPARLVELYRDLVSPDVRRDELFANDVYNPLNARNASSTTRLAHLTQDSNTLGAAVDLVARATVLRERAGRPVENQQELVVCSRLGNPFRQSDPQIAHAVNSQAAAGNEITLRDPVGLYIDAFDPTGLEAPDGADPASFWSIERGDAQHAVRARFEVPSERDYVVGDLKLAGRPVAFGAQLADLVRVRATVLVAPAEHTSARLPCIASPPA